MERKDVFKISVMALLVVFVFIGSSPVQGKEAFKETFGTEEIKPFTGEGANNPWTVTGETMELRGQGEADHTGDGVGIEAKATENLTDTMLETVVDARGASGYVEFWIKITDAQDSGGWAFQVDSGSGFVTKLKKEKAEQADWEQFHYDLQKGELIENLKIRFQFNHQPERACLDDIIVVVK